MAKVCFIFINYMTFYIYQINMYLTAINPDFPERHTFVTVNLQIML